MDYFELIKNRHSVRNYTNYPLEEYKIKQILEAASLAPSAGNLQAYIIIQISNKELQNKIAEYSLKQSCILNAQALLIFCAYYPQSVKKYGTRGLFYSNQDATIACSYAQLAAEMLSIGNVWVGAFESNNIRKLLNLSEDILPISILCLGYSNESSIITPRKNLQELVYKV
jgi:nitroreductase